MADHYSDRPGKCRYVTYGYGPKKGAVSITLPYVRCLDVNFEGGSDEV